MEIGMFLLGLGPILWMIVALCGLKMAGHKASFVAMVLAAVLAITVWKLPLLDTASAALEGFAMAAWPIILVIIAAVFLYNLSLHTGKMEVIKQMITSVSGDKRLLVLLIGWCFGGFMEGMAGFGTAIAIPAGMLAGMGFPPLLACLVCLVANGTPTPFGSIGIPTVICSLLVTIVVSLRHEKRCSTPLEYQMTVREKQTISVSEALRAWSPFILVFLFLLSTSKLVAPLHTFFNQFASSVLIYTGEGGTPYTFSWVNTPGVWIFLAAIIGGFLQGASLQGMLHVLKGTLIQMSRTMITMLCVLATAKIMGYSGMIASIANMFVQTLGLLYPLAAPLIGGLGTFVTGSGTSSSVLFGNVQLQAAQAIGADPYWMVALNSLGVAVGKMMAPQSLAIGLVAVNESGKDGELLKRVFPYALAYLVIMAVIAYFGMGLFELLPIT